MRASPDTGVTFVLAWDEDGTSRGLSDRDSDRPGFQAETLQPCDGLPQVEPGRKSRQEEARGTDQLVKPALRDVYDPTARSLRHRGEH